MNYDSEIQLLSRRLISDPDNPLLREKYHNLLCRCGLHPVKDDHGRLSIYPKDSDRSDVVLAEFHGAIDPHTVAPMQKYFEQVIETGRASLVIDCGRVKYINCTGLGSLVKYADAFQQKGGGIYLVKVPAKVQIVIEMLGLHAFFFIEKDLKEAMDRIDSELEEERPKLPNLHPPFIGTESLHEWEFFVLEEEDERCTVLVNTAIWNQVPQEARPYRITVSLPFLAMNAEALIPPLDEIENLERFEANFLRRFRIQHEAQMISRKTYRDNREFTLHGPNGTFMEYRKTLDELLKSYPRYSASLSLEADPDWSVYSELVRSGIDESRLESGK
ncbi:MAG: DUF695 domain-containing protein [Planctomycetota bacterium]|nr:DUF695 domain-containing protein [Planctomycetota bacterium]